MKQGFEILVVYLCIIYMSACQFEEEIHHITGNSQVDFWGEKLGFCAPSDFALLSRSNTTANG